MDQDGELDIDYELVDKRRQRECSSLKNFGSRIVKKDKKKLLKYATSTSTHGVKYLIVGKSIIRRLFWSFLFVVFLILCLYNVINSIIRYVDIPITTTVSSKHVESLELPIITICNLNQFNQRYLEERDISGVVDASVNLELSNATNFQDEYHQQCSTYKTPASYSVTIEELFRNGGQRLEDFIVDCRFLGLPCNLEEDFIPTHSPAGLCYTYNLTKAVRGSGYRHELNLILNVDQHNYVGSLNNEAGVRVSLQPKGHPPLPVNYGYFIPVGKSAYMGMQYTEIEDNSNLPGCIQNNANTSFNILTGFNYSLSACLHECVLRILADECGCLDFYETPPANISYANMRRCTVADLCCITATLSLAAECVQCELSCHHPLYEVTTTYASYPSFSKREGIAERYNTTVEVVGESFISLHIYFDELIKRREVTTRSYSLISLIADIGGQMGLFLGASVISLTEFLVWLIDEFKDRCLNINDNRIKRISVHAKDHTSIVYSDSIHPSMNKFNSDSS